MSRKLLVTIHLALAAFFSPILIVVGISGGLYLIGEKGQIDKQEIYRGDLSGYDFSNKDRENQIRQFIQLKGIEHEFEYAKGGTRFAMTRPTSKPYLFFQLDKEELVVSKRTPNFIASIIELHKGHGPTMFKTFQKFMAVGLLIILLSGLILGLTSKLYRFKTLAISGFGLITLLYFALF
jgi:hypothetical protein